MVTDSVVQRNVAAGFFHVLAAPSPQRLELFIGNLHSCRQHIHHHVQINRQLEEQTTDAVLRILNRTAQDGRQCGREISGGILTGDVAGVEPDGLLDELVLCTVVVSRTHLFDELLCLRERFAVRT